MSTAVTVAAAVTAAKTLKIRNFMRQFRVTHFHTCFKMKRLAATIYLLARNSNHAHTFTIIRMDISLIYGRTFRFNEKCYAIIDFLHHVQRRIFFVTKQNDLNGVGI